MRPARFSTVLMLALASAAAAQPADLPGAAAAHSRAIAALEADRGLVAAPGMLLVRFDPASAEAQRATARQLLMGQSVRRYSIVPGLELIQTQVGLSTAAQLMRGLPFVEYVEPDSVVHTTATPNDPSFGQLWGMLNSGQTVNGAVGTAGADIHADQAWSVFAGDQNFTIADIDTGMQITHPDLAANVWTNPGEIAGNGIDDDGDGYIDDVNGWNFYDRTADVSDLQGHGTHTAGTIGASGNNGVGVCGVNWRCRVVPLKFIGPNGGYTSDAVLAIQYATSHGIKVSNNSWGSGDSSQSLYDAINAARSSGHIFVAAAGNNGTSNDTSPFYPASYQLDNIIAVAATDSRDNRASFSNYGATSVDLGAPGVSVYSTYPGGYAFMDGTSMAAPHVTGVVALVYAMHPTWTYGQVRQQVLSTVRPAASMAGITVTGGILNAAAAVGAGAPANTAPVVTISAPADGAAFSQGSSVTFTGSSMDTQDGNISAGIVWTSNLQGQIGTGATFARSDLTAGSHTITASSRDSGGLSGTGVVHISIAAAGTAPAAPGSPTATSLGGGSARVQWADNSSNETGFEIQREVRSGNSWGGTTTAGSVGASVTTFTDSPGSGKYRYRVRAVNSSGASAWTGWANVNIR